MANKAQLKGKKAITRRVLVPVDDAMARVIQDASEAVTRAKLVGGDVDAADKRYDQLQDELIEQGALLFTFRGIGRTRYEALRLEHAPSDEQRAKAEADKTGIQWNPDTFPAALCAAACTDSDMNEDEWRKLVFESDDWGSGELAMLFNAALEANSDRRVVALGN